MDFMAKLTPVIQAKDGTPEKEVELKKLEEYLPKFTEILENRLKQNAGKPYIVGDKLSVADINLVSLFTNQVNPTLSFGPYIAKALEANATLAAYIKHHQENELKEYAETRKATIAAAVAAAAK